MPFIDVARALFAYAPQSNDELQIHEDDLVYVVSKGDDDWWKVKKKVAGDDDGPVGLVPQNYLEPVTPISSTRTLYDYTAQTEEELSFSADLTVEIYDKDDADWFLVGLKQGDSTAYGFVPSNYLDDGEVESAAKLPSVIPAGRPDSLDERRPITPPPLDEDERDEPISPSNAMTAYGRPEQHYTIQDPSLEQKFKTWQVEEVDYRKRRKKGTLGIGNQSIVWSCDADKTPVQTWPITSLIEYNTEKKHLFIELSSPPTAASFHFHASSRAEAESISDAIGEIAGAVRATGLREVAAASGDPLPPLPETSALAQRHRREDSDDEMLPVDDGVKRGVLLYDFEAQGDDELGVRQDQIVEILDSSHEEWWKCRAGNQEGVVPASYVEVIKTRPASKRDTMSGAAAALASAVTGSSGAGPRPKKPTSPTPSELTSSLSKPDPLKTRTWTDRSGSFKVEAQFLGFTDGKIQLHKLNGVKISVPIQKMSVPDVQYVERITGKQTGGRNGSPTPPKPPPDSEKPARRIDFDWFAFFLESGVDYNVCQRYAIAFQRDQMDESILPDINAQTLRTLGVREGDILRVMKRLDDKFGRSTAGRKKSVRFGGEEIVDEEDEKTDLSDVLRVTAPGERKESLFSSGPGGALRNNTSRRGRPTAGGRQVGDVDGAILSPVSATADGDKEESPEREKIGVRPLKAPPSRLTGFKEKEREGFEDDAWTVKKTSTPQPQEMSPPRQVITSPLPQTGPAFGSAIHDLATISPNPPTTQSLPPQMQPQPAQLSPQNTATAIMLNRSSSVPPIQATPQAAPLQPHYTGLPPGQPSLPPAQPAYIGPTPAQASGNVSLSEQLVKLQIYRQQQRAQSMIDPLQTYNPAMMGYANGLQPQQGLTPQATGYMPNFLPAGQQSSVLGPTRSFSMGLPAPLIPTNTAASLQTPTQQLIAHRTGPANFSPTTSQFLQQPQQPFPPLPQQQFQVPQPTTYQPAQFPPQPQFQQPQPTGFQAQPSFVPPAQGLTPQQTGFQQQMLPQKTGAAAFKPVSFGTKAKPLVPSRTGRRANLAAATPENPFGF